MPIWNIMEDQFEMLLVNAQHIKQVPGRKTDVKDAEWIVQVLQLKEKVSGPFCRFRDEAWTTLHLVIRHRRDLVCKGAALNCQIRNHLQAALPGYEGVRLPASLWPCSLPPLGDTTVALARSLPALASRQRRAWSW
jgi:hypothetical protein